MQFDDVSVLDGGDGSSARQAGCCDVRLGVRGVSCGWPSRVVPFAVRSDQLTAVCFASSVSPAAMFVASHVDALRKRGDVPYCTVHIVDSFSEAAFDVCQDRGIVTTPALAFQYGGKKLTIRRPGWSDADQCECCVVSAVLVYCVSTLGTLLHACRTQMSELSRLIT